MGEISENEVWSFKEKRTFLSPFYALSDDFDMGSHDFNFDTLGKKANIKANIKESLHKIWSVGAI